MAVIYIVEDDKHIQEIEAYAMKNSGYDVSCFDDGAAFDKGLEERIPDLVLLDIMLPGEDGLSILKRLRNTSSTKEIPVILVTAKDTEIDTVKGLDLGADDYLTKPFGIMELISRVKAILRRSKPATIDTVLRYQEIYMDLERHICKVNDEVVELTFKEYQLLQYFLVNVGIVLSRDSIMSAVWESDFAGESRTVDMHIKTLRKKLGDAGSHIVTVRNVGYKLQ